MRDELIISAGNVVIIPVAHDTLEDFNIIKPLLEQRFKEAIDKGLKIIFVIEWGGIEGHPYDTLRELAEKHNMSLEPKDLIENEILFEGLREYYDTFMKTAQDHFQQVLDGKISLEKSDLDEFTIAQISFVFQYEDVKIIVEEPEFIPWAYFTVGEYYHEEAFDSLLKDGDFDAYLKKMKRANEFMAEGIKLRDKHFVNQLIGIANSNENSIILTPRGGAHEIEEEKEGIKILMDRSIEWVLSPIHELIIAKIKGEKIIWQWAQLMNAQQLPFNIGYDLLSLVKEKIGNELERSRIAREISDRWDIRECAELGRNMKNLAQAYEYFKNWIDNNGTDEEKELFELI
jgi:hypothetical protein